MTRKILRLQRSMEFTVLEKAEADRMVCLCCFL